MDGPSPGDRGHRHPGPGRGGAAARRRDGAPGAQPAQRGRAWSAVTWPPAAGHRRRGARRVDDPAPGLRARGTTSRSPARWSTRALRQRPPAPGVRLDRRGGPGAAGLLPGEAGRRGAGRRIRPALDDAARHPVPQPAGRAVRRPRPGSGCCRCWPARSSSRWTCTTSRPGWSSWPRPSRPGGCCSWVGPRSARWTSWPGPGCGRGAAAPVLPLPLPGGLARAVRAGGLTAPEQPRGTGTFEQYLGSRCQPCRTRLSLT